MELKKSTQRHVHATLHLCSEFNILPVKTASEEEVLLQVINPFCCI